MFDVRKDEYANVVFSGHDHVHGMCELWWCVHPR